MAQEFDRRLYVIKWTPTKGRLRGLRHSTEVTNMRWANNEMKRLWREGAARIEFAMYLITRRGELIPPKPGERAR